MNDKKTHNKKVLLKDLCTILASDKDKDKDKDFAKKFKKNMLVYLVLINENSNLKNKLENDFMVIINILIKSLSKEKKFNQTEAFNTDLFFEEANNIALKFRNLLMHIKKDSTDYLKDFEYLKENHKLLDFVDVLAQQEIFKLTNAPSKTQDNLDYWNSIHKNYLNFTKTKDVESIPLDYILASVFLLLERKIVNELLSIIKHPSFRTNWLSQFSLRGGYKSILMYSDEQENLNLLHKNQLDLQNSKDFKDKILASKSLLFTRKELGDFPDKSPTKKDSVFYYSQMMRYYSYSNSYPKIEEFESDIKDNKAKDLALKNKEYNDNCTKENKINFTHKNTNIEEIKKSFTYVFRRGDVFMREAMLFLSNFRPDMFCDNWRIAGNSVIFTYSKIDTNKIKFNLRRRVKPSLNAHSSIFKPYYPIGNNTKTISLSRHNLQALLTSILLGNTVNFNALIETATAIPSNKSQSKSTNKDLWIKIYKDIENWNREKKARFILKDLRKSLPHHLHLKESYNFHDEAIYSLYMFNNNPNKESMDKFITMFSTQGSINRVVKKFIENAYDEYSDNQKDDMLTVISKNICQKKRNTPANNTNPNKSDNKSQNSIYTWSSYAFNPTKSCKEDIKKALGWQQAGSLFDLLNNHANNNNYQLPMILEIYLQNRCGSKDDNFTFIDVLSKYSGADRNKELEIRSTLSEELLLTNIAFHYLNKLKDLGKLEGADGFMKLVSTQADVEKRSPVNFSIRWKIENRTIEIPLSDYMKKDIRMAINWIFDASRVYDLSKKKVDNHKEVAAKALKYVLLADDTIKNHIVLSQKVHKPEPYDNKNLNASAIKNIFSRIIWLQKELLNFIIDIEKKIVWELSESNKLPPKELGGYFNFSKLVEEYNNHINKNSILLGQLIAVRNMLAHARLYNEPTNNYKEITIAQAIDIIDKSLKLITDKTLADKYKKPTKETNYYSR